MNHLSPDIEAEKAVARARAAEEAAQHRERYEDEEEFEPVLGLPEIPPEGEHILWQGRPRILPVARRVFRVGLVALYFAVLFVWAVYERFDLGQGLLEASKASLILLIPFGFITVMLFFLGGAVARTSVYTLTNRRLVLRVGVALSKAVNLPFAQIDSVAVRSFRDGTVDIAIKMQAGVKPKYMLLWPHVRPWAKGETQPMLRGIPEGDPVIVRLREALLAYHGQEASHGQEAGVRDAPVQPVCDDNQENQLDVRGGARLVGS